MSDGNMTYEDWLRGCVHHDGRHGYVTLPCDEVLKIADFIERLRADRNTEPQYSEDDMYWLSLAEDVANGKMSDAEANQAWFEYINRKTENSSEKPNNSTISKMEQVETMSCAECKHRPIGAEICEEPCHYEPQTDWHYDEQDATWYPYKHEDEPQERSE